MGWFSPDVLGGDTPMDILSVLGETLGEYDLYPLQFSSRRRALLRAKLESAGDTLLDLVSSVQFVYGIAETETSYPVLAACYLATGAAMPEGLRMQAAAAARTDTLSAPETVWAAGTGTRMGWPERRAYMAALADAIEIHQPGDVFLDFSHVGLLERLSGRQRSVADETTVPALGRG